MRAIVRIGTGLGLLAVSWLLGLGYYYQADWPAWVVVVGAGTLLLAGAIPGPSTRSESIVAALLLSPLVVCVPWPYRMAAALLWLGSILHALPIPRRWPQALASGMLSSGVVLLAQSLGMLVYEGWTARSHDLPYPLARLLGLLASLVGMDAATAGHDVVLGSMRQPNPLAASWELFLDPPTFCFMIGGMCLLAMRSWSAAPAGRRAAGLAASAAAFLVCVLAWLPLRSVLLMALYLHRVLRTDYSDPLHVMNQFWSPWLHLLLLAGPVLLAWRFVRVRERPEAATAAAGPVGVGRAVPACVLAFVAAGILTAAALWVPSGPRKAGRVVIDEYHSAWEPTTRAYDTEWYGSESGYNYYCLFDYCSRYYDMSRLTGPIDDAALRDCDVLVLKVPDRSRYAEQEIAAIEQFVLKGGGLALIGEHTDVYKTGTHLNDVARRFGFTFRYDCLFGVDSFFDQLFRRPWVPHPAVQHFPTLDFAVSCSIAPGGSLGRAPIVATGLKNLGADYHASNFYPQAEDHPEMRYGAFVQLWTTQHGDGRVAAFGDSTQFSNFCLFDPGKSELMLGMLEWLNHCGPYRYLWIAMLIVGAAMLAACMMLSRGWGQVWLLLLAAGMLGWLSSAMLIRAAHPHSTPVPPTIRPMTRVVFDRTVSGGGLPKNGFVAGKADEFGIFERWVLRLGYFTSRAAGSDAFTGDLLVFLNPSRDATPEFRGQLVDYVQAGGKVLVVDSPENKNSTANQLLHVFGLRSNPTAAVSGELNAPPGWSVVNVESAGEIDGGRPWAHVQGRVVAASASFGQGLVTAIGFGSRFSDANMGVTGDIVPDAGLRQVYELEFATLRAIVENRIVPTPTSSSAGE